MNVYNQLLWLLVKPARTQDIIEGYVLKSLWFAERAGMRPFEDHYNFKEELPPRARMTVSPNGSITECRDGAEQDWEVPWPRPPNFDDEEPSSFFTNCHPASSLPSKDTASDSHSQSSISFAPSLSQPQEVFFMFYLAHSFVLSSHCFCYCLSSFFHKIVV